jgi:hypothetical protein
MRNRLWRSGGLLSWGVAAVFLWAAPASAYTVTQIGPAAGGNPGDLCGVLGGTTCQPYFEVSGLVAGDSFDLTWSLDGSQILGPDLVPDFPTLAAQASLTVTSVSTSQVVLDITLSNLTDPSWNPVGFEGGIVSFGMELVGFASGSLSVAGASLDTYATNNIAGGPGLTVDFCAATDASCNSGTALDGIGNGASDSFQFDLAGTFDVAGITLSNFATKWQTNYESLVTPDDPNVVAGNSSFEQPGLPGGVVPEPATALLFGLGLLGLAVGGRPHQTRDR